MSTPITARANVAIDKVGRPFTRNRYQLSLYIEDVYTGLHWHVNRKQAKAMPQMIINNAARLLEDFDLMEEFHDCWPSKGPALPTPGTRVKLTEDMGAFPKGHEGTVVSAEWDKDTAPDHQYPVAVALTHGRDGAAGNMVLALDEFEVVK